MELSTDQPLQGLVLEGLEPAQVLQLVDRVVQQIKLGLMSFHQGKHAHVTHFEYSPWLIMFVYCLNK